ncbi:MAG: biotin synthase BioB [Deltaproteobacteria bacterium]|nr:biotin synthase BioB [Deltaproteobacteria bacterium]
MAVVEKERDILQKNTLREKNEKEETLLAELRSFLPRLLAGEGLAAETARRLGSLGEPFFFELLALCGRVRKQHCGDHVALCAITNAKSGRCPEDCAFCAQSSSYATGVASFPLIKVEELEARGRVAAAMGVENFSVVTSGTAVADPDEQAAIEKMLRRITELGMVPCASLGFLEAETARRYRAAGLRHYHHNLETARSFFPEICTTHEYEQAVATVRTAQEAGLYVCSGGIMGLGESWEQRVELALTLRELGVDSIPLNFLQPVQGTPLEDEPGLTPWQSLLTIAMFRLVCPTCDIRICGGRQRAFGDFQGLIFAAGANGLMVGNYLTTSGRNWSDDRSLLEAWVDFV